MASTIPRLPRRKDVFSRSRWRTKLLLSLTILVLLSLGMAAWTTQNFLWRFPSTPNHGPLRAVLIDQLSLNYPDPSFVTNVTDALMTSGYAVDYIGPTANAVDVFRQLPSQGYDMILVRAHTGGGQSIITTEPYSKSAREGDQRAGTLVPAQIQDGPLYFALTSNFVRQEMAGSFSGSTVIIMGCGALQGSQNLAASFLDRGANFFVGWDGSVTIIHTDISTVDLVKQIALGRSLPDATKIAGTADPVYGARLEYLDWNTLVQGRINTIVSQLTIWVVMGAILLLGPLAVFVSPKLLDIFERSQDRASRRKKHGGQKMIPA